MTFQTSVTTPPEQVAISVDEQQRLHHWVRELAVNARVRIEHRDGALIEGVVTVTPTVQTFKTRQGEEGFNGSVKLVDPARPDWSALVWLGDIRAVTHLDSVVLGSTRA